MLLVRTLLTASKTLHNVFITGGGTGFIGKHLGAVLRGNSYNVTVISRMPATNNISWTTLNEQGLPKDTCAMVNLAGQPLMDFTKSWSPG